MSAIASGLGGWMNRGLSFLDDRINPIVVKELRQAVQSRFVGVVLTLYLAIEFFAMMLMLINNPQYATDFQAGRAVFMLLQSILLGTCLLFVTGYVGIRMAAERSDQNVDLVFITTIRPRSIVWGKAVIALALTALIFSACAPFMVMTYLLRGIDLPSIGVVLVVDLAEVMGAAMFALFIAAMPTRLATKVLLGIVLLGAMFVAFGSTLAYVGSRLYVGMGGRLGSWDFWGPALSCLLLFVVGCGLLLYVTGFMLTPAAANRARPVRIYVTLAWLVTGGLAYGIQAGWPGFSTSTNDWLVYAWVWCVMPILVMAILLGVSERDEWGPRVAGTIPRRVAWRPLWLLFSSGALGGTLWACGLIVLTLGSVAATSYTWFGSGPHLNIPKLIVGETAFACFVLAYGLTAVLIRDYVLRRRARTALIAPIALLMMATGTIIPVFVAFFVSPRNWDREQWRWLVVNPVSGLTADNWSDRTFSLEIAAAWCGVVILLNVPWALRQLRACRPPGAEPTEGEDVTAATAAPTVPVVASQAAREAG